MIPAIVIVALIIFVSLRLLNITSVIRANDIILSGNDPYAYRHLTEQLLAQAATLDLLQVLASESLTATGEPLLLVFLWLPSTLLGGSPTSTGFILALYPIVASTLTAMLLYKLSTEVTGDWRVGVASIVILAFIPAHAVRTRLGFADHHAFDYLWLVVTALAAVSLFSATNSRRQWRWGGVLGVGVAAQSLAWGAGPLLVAPLALIVVVKALTDLSQTQSPIQWGGPFVFGTVTGTAVTVSTHLVFGWQDTLTIGALGALSIGTAVVVLLAEAVHRYNKSVRAYIALHTIVLVCALLSAVFVVDSVPLLNLERQLQRLFHTPGISEALPLYKGSLLWNSTINFGFILILGFPYLLQKSLVTIMKPNDGFVVLASYTWWLLLLTFIQVRFAGELSHFLAVFGGIGTVSLASKLQSRTHSPPESHNVEPTTGQYTRSLSQHLSRRNFVARIGLLGMIGGTSAVRLPFAVSGVSDSEYAAIVWMREYASQQEWDFPQSRVLSSWGNARLYNYHVNGQSRSYGFSYQNYGELLSTSDPEGWSKDFNDKVGFIVVRRSHFGPMYTELFVKNATDVPNYELGFVSEDESLKVFVSTN